MEHKLREKPSTVIGKDLFLGMTTGFIYAIYAVFAAIATSNLKKF